jgi:hypothetical protein
MWGWLRWWGLMMSPLPWSGLGLGWRPEIAALTSALPARTDRFAIWAADRPPRGSLHDGWDFARHLADAGELPELAVIELTERERGWRWLGPFTS